MLLQVPRQVKTFVWYWCRVPAPIMALLGVLITGVVVVRGRRTLSNIGSVVVEERRHVSNVSRFLQDKVDDIVGAFNRACRRAINKCVKRARKRGNKRWIFIIDTTFQRKHAMVMPNLILFKDKAKGVPASNHAFVVGILVGPDGVRIPLPISDFLTERSVAEANRQLAKGEQRVVFRTQVDLAADLVRQCRSLLPTDMELWVVADNFFEGPKLDQVCDPRKGIYYVMPLDSGRVLAGKGGGKGAKVRSYEKSLPDEVFHRIALVDGKEPFAPLRRREEKKRKRGRPIERVYRVARCELELSGLGKRTVFFSWKHRRHRYNTKRAKAHLKMLVTNKPDATAEEVVDAYFMRWQIELFFRELKSDLGFGHYQVLTVKALRAHVHLSLLAFLFLEMYRLNLLKHRDPRWLAAYRIRQSRTRQLVLVFEAESQAADLTAALRLKAGPGKLARLVDRLQPRRVRSKVA